jgi:3-polyprenyl-4-hydroxybenzoate decarboxylase
MASVHRARDDRAATIASGSSRHDGMVVAPQHENAVRMGAVIAPSVPAFYSNPQSIDDLIDHTVGRVVGLFGLDMPQLRRWTRMRGVTELSPGLK